MRLTRGGRPVLVDTSILIDHLRGREEARALLVDTRQAGRLVCSSSIVRTELLGGMRSDERGETRALLEVIEWISVDAAIADRAGEFARRYRRSHSGIDIADYLIAAAADVVGAELKTRNTKHFPMFPDLESPY